MSEVLPKSWSWERLDKIATLIAGQSPPGATYRDTPEGLPFFQGKADFGKRYPVARTWCTEPIKIALPDDILISVRAPVGSTNIAEQKCCIGRGLAAIRPAIDRDYLFFVLQFYQKRIADLGSGSTFEAISMSELAAVKVPVPPSLSEQRHIAAVIDAHLQEVERARAAVLAQIDASEQLMAAYLRDVFDSDEARAWEQVELGNTSTMLPAKSISNAGDTEVRAITTACLTEQGFNPKGIKTARMWARDAVQAIVSRGEILIARSNTPELVGRVSMFPGEPLGVVASDLTIRLMPTSGLLSEFLTAYLSYLYLSGYWKDRAGGASGTMKKITRGQIATEIVPRPELEIQEQVVHFWKEQTSQVSQISDLLKKQLGFINEFLPAIMQRAFAGEL